jgi:hypothetical protein
MAATKGEVLGGFVIRPHRLRLGEEIKRSQAAYRKFLGVIDIPGVLFNTNARLIWITLWWVKSIERDEIDEVSLHRKWGLSPFPHWSVRVKTRSRTDFFRLKPSLSWFPWGLPREKEIATRWVAMVKHWANQ